MIITTPINPFGDDFRSEIETIAEEVEWWSRYRSEMERLVSEPRVYGEDAVDGDDFIDAVVKSSASLATNRWTYTCEPAEWDDTNKKYITLDSTTQEYTAYNATEAANTASIALHGYDLSPGDYTLAVQSIPVDTHVRLRQVNGAAVFTFSEPNELVVTCTAAADSMTVPTLYIPSNSSVTTTSGTYAVITAWTDPTVIDPNVFTWTKATGIAEAGEGEYLVQWHGYASAATNDATIGLKGQYKIDAGSWTDIPGTLNETPIATLASYTSRIEGRGYVTVASGEDLDLRLVVARLAGTGTPTVPSGSLFFEVQQVGT